MSKFDLGNLFIDSPNFVYMYVLYVCVQCVCLCVCVCVPYDHMTGTVLVIYCYVTGHCPT